MTTITAVEPTIHQPAGRLTRRTIASFLTGVVLTAAVAVGVNAATDDAAPSTSGVRAAHVASMPEPGCYVLRGAC